MKTISLKDKLALFDDLWKPKVVARMNDTMFKLVKIKDEFIWHRHEDTDEVFMVIHGRLRIEFRDENGPLEPALLGPGEMCVVPRGVEHKPCAEDECHLLVIEPAGVVNTGDSTGGDAERMSAPVDDWL